jgi:hypothetical protein
VPFTFSIDLQKASQPSAVVGEIARTRATDCESSGCLPKAVASLQDETNRTNEMRTTLRGVAELRVDGDEEEQDETEGSFAVHRSPLVDFNKPDATDSWRESRRQDLSGSSDEEPISTEGLTPFFAQESRPGADGWVSARGTRGATRKQARLRQQSAPRFHSCSVTRAMGAKEHNTNPSSGTVSRPRVVAFPPGLHMPTASPLVRW